MDPKGTATAAEDWRELYPFESHYFDVGGHRLHYLDEGTGAPVVMLHGNPTWSFLFRDMVKACRVDRRVIVPDHMGCGLSDKPAGYEYRLATHVDNLERLLDRCVPEGPIDLVLHDWGGAIGMGYAVRHPERIGRLVVMNTAAFLSKHCPLRIRICRIPGFGALAVRGWNGFAKAAVRMAVAKGTELSPAVKQGYLHPYDSYANRIATLRFVQDIPLQRSHPTWEVLTGIQKKLHLLAGHPMLICWGEQDFCFGEPFLQVWLQYFPEAEVHRFPQAGHYLLEDVGSEVLALVRPFLGAGSDG